MFGQTVLERVNSTKFLGLYVDDCLSWNVHTAYLCRKLSRSVGIISLFRHYVNQEILLSIYYALIVSHLQYGLILWGSAANVYIQSVHVLQKRALRLMTFKPQTYHSRVIAYDLKILLLDELYFKACMLFLHSVYYNYCTCSVSEMFVLSSNTHSHITKQSNFGFNLPRVRLNITKNFVNFHGVQLWNSLSSDLKCIVSPSKFKLNVHNHLLSLYH